MRELVLVHGAWHGAWCWRPLLAALADEGIHPHAVELPFTGIGADAGALVEALDALDGDKVVVGHSYGGMVVSDAVDGRDDVAHLVYLCALMLEIGDEPFAMFRADADAAKLFDAIELDEATGLGTPIAEAASEIFYTDCDPQEVARFIAMLRPFPMMSLAGVHREPWRSIDSTYVVCSRDRTIPPSLQRSMATRANHIVEWQTGHSPFVNRPDLLVDLLIPLLRENR